MPSKDLKIYHEKLFFFYDHFSNHIKNINCYSLTIYLRENRDEKLVFKQQPFISYN